MLRRLPLLVALLLPCACDPPAPPGAPPTAATTLTPAPDVAAAALARARELVAVHAQADPPQALELLSATFGSAPSDPEAAFLLARAAFRAEAPARCRTALDAYFAHAPADRADWSAEAWLLRGWLLEREGRFAEAPPLYARALELSPRYAFALFRTGNALSESGDDAGALPWVDRALAERPALLEAHFLRAQLLRRLGRAEEAAQAALLHKLLNDTQDNVATTRESVVQKVAALEQLEKLLPRWFEGRLQLTQLQLRFGQQELALTRLKALVVEPDAPRDGWLLLIDLLRKSSNDALAQRDLAALLRKAKGIAPELRAELEKLASGGFPR